MVLKNTTAGIFYNVQNESSYIMTKSSSKNLNNENKHWCFVVFTTKLELKCQFSGNMCLFGLVLVPVDGSREFLVFFFEGKNHVKCGRIPGLGPRV